MNGSHQDNRQGVRGNKRRRRRIPGGSSRSAPPVVFTPEGTPAAVPDAPPVSPVVFVSDEARAQYPWIPGRVIAGSVWRGPGHERVRIDEQGQAQPYKTLRRAG